MGVRRRPPHRRRADRAPRPRAISCACCARSRACARSRCPPTATSCPSWPPPARRGRRSPQRQHRHAGRGPLRRPSLAAAISAACSRASRRRAPRGYRSIKLNTVAVKGFNDHELGALCDVTPGTRGLVPRFIEQMPMAGGALYVPGELLSAAEIRARIEAAPRARAWSPTAAARPAARARPATGASDGAPTKRAAAPRRHHLGDDRALLRHLQPRAPLGLGRPAHLPRPRRRRRPAPRSSTVTARGRAGHDPASRGRSSATATTSSSWASAARARR